MYSTEYVWHSAKYDLVTETRITHNKQQRNKERALIPQNKASQAVVKLKVPEGREGKPQSAWCLLEKLHSTGGFWVSLKELQGLN